MGLDDWIIDNFTEFSEEIEQIKKDKSDADAD